MSIKQELAKYDFSSVSEEELCFAIDKDKLVFMIKIYPESNNTSLYVWGYKIGYTSCWLSCRDNHPWDLTSCNFTLDKIGNYDYDDMTPASELFDFTEDMSKEQRIKKWRELYDDSLHWKLSCGYDDFCEEHRSKKALCKYLHNEIAKNNLQKVYIVSGIGCKDICIYGKKIMTLFLNENTSYYSECRGLE